MRTMFVVLSVMIALAASCGSEASEPESDGEAIDAGYLAACKDGTYSDNSSFGGTCSSHDGVEKWLATYGRCSDGTVVRLGKDASCSDDDFDRLLPADFEPKPEGGDVALCKDGTYSDNTSFRGTCSSHGEVERWLAGYGECSDGTVIEINVKASCPGDSTFDRLLPDYEPPPEPEPAPEPQPSPVAAWGDEHLDNLARVHGTMVGVINATGELFDLGLPDEAVELCSTAVDAPFLDEAEPAIAAYPGEEDFAGSWATFRSASNDYFNACAASQPTTEALGVREAADAGLGISVIVAISEIEGGTIDPESDRTTKYDDTREQARAAKVLELKTIAIGQQPR